ncbi:MAG: type II toxin-antitoxin system VapC family toxin [Acidobacteria bacterium]|nr:type II toxin-antitoxin system VapC family toxin [Acidobacteriota bacterium]MBK8150202.1 type II toxin-antitoxin system VapC family toxin [Acidobacteriota bacterium]MBK8810013.1 type II toxin-antitoxin system VapC family toxin [Acidobacteriota bacterium]
MKQSLYLETSVVGAYLDNGEPFRRDLTIRWWEHELSEYRVFSSELVRRELERVAEPHRSGYLNLIKPLESLDVVEEVAILAEGYVSRGIFQRRFLADAVHVAIASFYKVDYLVTWNFGHLANVRKQARIKLFNTAAGFFSPSVVTPEFLVHSL